MDEVTLPYVDTSPETIARKAAEKAAQVDRELARTQPAPNLPPIGGEEKVPVRVGSIELPFYSPLRDPARVTGTHSRVMRQFRPRVLECVACEYKKLETRLGDPAERGLDPERLRPDQRHHFGPGERDYTLCKSCYDTFGTLHPKIFELYAAKRMREDQQRTLRGAKNFPQVAARVARVDRWRRDVLAAREFGEALDVSPLGERPRRRGGRYDGFSDDRVAWATDFTDQRAEESPRRLLPPRHGIIGPEGEAAGEEQQGGPRRGRSRLGDPDPMWQANDAEYDAARVGADHAAAIIEDERWEARRTRIFRRRLAGIEKIEDPERRERARAALNRRWDARLSPNRRNPDLSDVTSKFAPVRKTLSPYPRTTLHSGVDHAFASEPAHVRAAHARHLAEVEKFLAEAPRKLRRMGYSEERIKELTTLPPLEPERIRRYPLDDPPYRERLKAERERKIQLAPAADLDQAVREGEDARWARGKAAEIVGDEARAARTSADEFIDLAGRVHAREKLYASVREADGAREHVSRWAHAIHRADRDLETATDAFAREVTQTFRDPRAFQRAFKQLSDEEKREMLAVLRERPKKFLREFRTAGGHDFGNAGRLVSVRRKVPAETTVRVHERSGVLTAEAGVRYLDAVRNREIVRVHAARALGVPESTGFDGLRDACRAQMRDANAKKAAAISERTTLGKVPSRRQLGAAFTGLSQQDRSRVLKEVPGVARLIEPRGRALARSGHSL